jgi:hypothetical protein
MAENGTPDPLCSRHGRPRGELLIGERLHSLRALKTAGACSRSLRCRTAGITPGCFWTMTSTIPKDALLPIVQRQGFTSQEIIRRSDGSFDITAVRARVRAIGYRLAASNATFCAAPL